MEASAQKKSAAKNVLIQPLEGKSWSADNGNGTFTNPLFYDEFSDPDIIRVGEDYYLAGTTMHSVPGLVVLHSKDLVKERCNRLQIIISSFSLIGLKDNYKKYCHKSTNNYPTRGGQNDTFMAINVIL